MSRFLSWVLPSRLQNSTPARIFFVRHSLVSLTSKGRVPEGFVLYLSPDFASTQLHALKCRKDSCQDWGSSRLREFRSLKYFPDFIPGNTSAPCFAPGSNDSYPSKLLFWPHCEYLRSCPPSKSFRQFAGTAADALFCSEPPIARPHPWRDPS